MFKSVRNMIPMAAYAAPLAAVWFWAEKQNEKNRKQQEEAYRAQGLETRRVYRFLAPGLITQRVEPVSDTPVFNP